MNEDARNEEPDGLLTADEATKLRALQRQAAIEQHTPLVKWVVGRMAVRTSAELDREDMISCGTIGLIQAVDRFDPTHGVSFRTYAVSRIRGSIIDALRASDHLPRSVRQKAKRLADVTRELSGDDGSHPTHSQLAAAMGMTDREYEEMRVNCGWQTTSLDSLMQSGHSGEDGGIAETTVDSGTQNFADRLEQHETLELLTTALSSLPGRLLLLVSLYYKEQLSMREICQVLNVSESRVSQLHQQALGRLRLLMQSDRVA